MCSINRVLFACVLIVASHAQKKELFGYPEIEEDENMKNKENRQPVYLPTVCPESELYYPGDQKDDWICDCKPAYLYHPTTDKCWPAFRRGPCADKEYLTLPEKSVIPVCKTNPCVVDGYAEWNNKCERLGSVLPCEYLFPTAAALGVNATTLVVSCVKLNIQLRFANVVPVSREAVCPPGCKRSINGKCVSS